MDEFKNLSAEDEAILTVAEADKFNFVLNRYESLLWRTFLKLAGIAEKALGIKIEIKLPFALIRSLHLSLQNSLNWLVDRGLVKKINDYSHLFADEPQFPIFSTILNPEYEVWSGGVGATPREALIKTIGEAMERYAQSAYEHSKLKVARHLELKDALDPLSFSGPSLEQREQRGWERWKIDTNSKFRWVRAMSLTSNKKMWVPAQLVYLPYHYHNDHTEPIINWPITTGAAAGLTENDAILRGILEVIERDAFIITYLNKLSPPRVDLEKSGEILKNLANEFKKYFLNLSVYSLPTDAPVAVMLAVISETKGDGPAVCVGAKAHHDPFEAARGAILEAYHVRIGARAMLKKRAREEDFSKIRTPSDHVLFWTSRARAHDLDFLNKSGKTVIVENLQKDAENTDIHLKNLLNFFSGKKSEVVWADLTSPNLKHLGIFMGKAIIPGLHPLFMDERYPCYGGKRLYKLPVSLGLLQTPLNEKDLNKLPHPFP